MEKLNFEWDENKNISNIEKHHIDFNDGINIFRNPLILKEDRRNDYGEKRWIAIGNLSEIIVVAVYTIRNDNIRIISIRIANQNEKQKYHENIK